ncbi:GLPGLI family protein [Chryseobacterium sp. Tr-659]|uniref:GLPGLI family protein n=1 Tax=Chryseobacterium sp. Tr-659 TaxID=2608340 RepID=UPI001422DD3B|nr:GLPGLI family protein [Chryseobacterium sp. Tr-659]
MKTFIVILLFSFAQNFYSQDMRIDYNLVYKEDTLSSETISKKMVLLVQDGESRFCTEKQYEVDSLRSTGFKGFIVPDNVFDAVKDKQNRSSRYYYILSDVYKLTDPILLNWKIEKEVAKKYGYNCQKATLSYKGRDWEAWFTQDIPLQEGPYVFKGLPGLIVEMEDKSRSYKFSFSGLKKSFYKMNIEGVSSKPMEISRNNFKKVMLDYYNDPFREMSSGNVKAKLKDEKGNDLEINFREMTKNVQSYLKKSNNPIELSEAIKYP